MTSSNPVGVEVTDISFSHGATPVLQGISLAAAPGQLLTLLGPSGCGKTTLLKVIGGYLSPSGGRVHIRGRDVTRLPPEARNAGMVFQHYALFPHLTAWRNVSFGLDVRRVARAERNRRVHEMLKRVGLAHTEHHRLPNELSGGQQQRVALARALVIQPDVLLLDEPLANLDRHLRDQLRVELRSLQKETGVTALMVTHDQEEALSISDQIGVMSCGRLLQIGPAAEVYHQPRTPFVARFLGAANLLDGKLLELAAARVMLRPEQCVLNPTPASRGWIWNARVASATFVGADLLVDVVCDNGVSLRLRTRPTIRLSPDEVVTVGIPAENVWPIPEAD